MKKIFILLGILSLTVTAAPAADKSITLSTYLPPPITTLNKLRLLPRYQNVPDLDDGCSRPGEIFMPGYPMNAVYFCPDVANPTWTLLPGYWTQKNNLVYFTDHLTQPLANIHPLRVGIGTSQPILRLTLMNDGSLIAAGPTIQDTVKEPPGLHVTTTGAGTRFFWYARRAAIYAGHLDTAVNTYLSNTHDIYFNDTLTVAEGSSNLGYGSVVFGENNFAPGYYCSIRGGLENAISNPDRGTVGNLATRAAIGGGTRNWVWNRVGSICGGTENQVQSPIATIGGGANNLINFSPPVDAAFVANPNWPNYWSAIGGGAFNRVDCRNSGVLGGGHNSVVCTLVNPVFHNYLGSFIGGGSGNTIQADNLITNIILGGENNSISRAALAISTSAIGGGLSNTITSNDLSGITNNLILGGDHNLITTSSTAAIGGGLNNMILAGAFSVIGGGSDHRINVPNSVILGGANNRITPGTGPNSGFIGGGTDNSIVLSGTAAIVGGQNNTVTGESAFIGGGQDNVASGDFSVVPGGQDNIAGGDYSLAAGRNTQITNTGVGTFAWGFDGVEGPGSIPTTIAAADAFIVYSGNVGIGEHTPNHRLHIDAQSCSADMDNCGGVGMRVSGAFTIGTLGTGSNPTALLYNTTTDLVGRDLAEIITASETVEAGDLVVMDQDNKMQVKKSSAAYDRKVVGIASSSPAMVFEGNQVVLGPKPFRFTQGTQPPVALKGQVLVKVSLENGPIAVGDALTSSSTPGHAMKATDPQKESGAIVGKALSHFKGGPKGETTGMLPVFVTLH